MKSDLTMPPFRREQKPRNFVLSCLWFLTGLLLAPLATEAETFTGQVVDQDRRGIAGVSVTWTILPGQGFNVSPGSAVTDVNGSFSGSVLAGGNGSQASYVFTYTKPNWHFESEGQRIETFRLGDPNRNLSLMQATHGPGTGQILSGSSGLPGVTVLPASSLTSSPAAPSVLIPQGSTTNLVSTRILQQPGFITGLLVLPSILHPRAGDIEITLIHPDGTEVRLRNSNASTNAYSAVAYSIAAANSAESMAVLLGKPASGPWKLRVRDMVNNSYFGSLMTWTIQITTGPVVTDDNGFFDAGIIERVQATPSHPAVLGFTPATLDIRMGVPVTARVDQGTILGRVLPATTNVLLQQKLISTIRLNVQQPPGNTSDASWAVPASNGTFNLTSRTLNGTSFSTNLFSGAINVVVLPSARGVTFSPSPLTSYAGATNANFTIVASPPVMQLPTSATVSEDNAYFGSVTVADLEQPVSALTVTAWSDIPTVLPADRITITGTGATRSMVLTPIQNQNGAGTVFVVVSDGALSTTNSFPFTVTPVVDIPTAGPGLALLLNGTNGYVSVTNTTVIPTSGDYTVEAWAYLNPGSTGLREIVSQGTFGNAFYLGVSGSIIRAGDTWQSTGVSMPQGVWVHLALVKNTAANSTALYTNGVLAAARTAITNPVSTEFRIGRQYGGNGEYWPGRIDEVRVWNVARTDSEIRRNMTIPVINNAPGLVAYYRFDEGSGIVAYDSASDVGTQSGPQDGYLINANYDANAGINNNLGIYRYTVDEDTPTPIFLTAVNVDVRPVNSNLTYSITAPPTRGTLSRTNGTIGSLAQNPIIYTPNSNYIGADSFTFSVSNAPGYTASAAVSINVANVNDLPAISPIADQFIIEDTTNVVSFVVSDSDTNQVPANLAVTVVFPAGGTVPIQTNWVITSQGTNRTLYIVPEKGEIGTTRVLVTVRDTPGDSTSTEFLLSVNPRPAYAVREIPALPGMVSSRGMAINARGQVAGISDGVNAFEARAFRYDGLPGTGSVTDLFVTNGVTSRAYGINDNGDIAGTMLLNGSTTRAFRLRNGVLTNLGVALFGDRSEARGINAAGDIAGFGSTNLGGLNRALFHANGSWTNLGSLTAAGTAEAYALNNAGQLAGVAFTNNASRAVLFDGANRLLVPLAGGTTNNVATALNDDGLVAGYMTTTNGLPVAFRWSQSAGLTMLGTFPGGYSIAYGVNSFQQVVGLANKPPNGQRAFLHSAGQLYDLNDLLPPDSPWAVHEARAINDSGWITGSGLVNGQIRGFVAIPAWVIGRKMARPLGATDALPPEIELIEQGTSFDTPQNAFYWSQVERRLYAIRPVTARLLWRVDANPGNTNRIVQVGVNVWPRNPTIHVANTPSEVQPQGAAIDHAYRELMFTTAANATVDPSAARFTATGTGYSVLRYLRSEQDAPNESVHLPAFDVVRTVVWNDGNHLVDNVPVFVGDTLTNAQHFDYLDRQGHVYFPNAFYDGAGDDRAYDRATRVGSIIPVNVPTATTAAPTNQLVVVWYRTNRLGVAWSGLPVRYAVSWPANTTNRISLANGLGSGALLPALHPDKRVYVQPNPHLPGYNPNEEHALFAPSEQGDALYALRIDLNAGLDASQPYALLKFRDPGHGKWRMRTYKVVFDGDPLFSGVAGNPVQPPLPLSVMAPACTSSRVLSGPGWTNHNGTIYAKAAGLFGTRSNLVVYWWYPLQPGFYYPANEVRSGDCVPWLTVSPVNNDRTIVQAIYDIRWPDDPPILNIGESLLTPKRGLPGVKDWADASIVYDDIDPADSNKLLALARFYDPLTPRTITNDNRFVIPASIKQELIIGKVFFPQLPYHLKRRLTYNPQTRELTFAGVLDESAVFGGPDNPLLLPNVISPREKDMIKSIATGDGAGEWNKAIDKLYALTRNPNGVDLSPKDGVTDAALRLGLTMQGTNAVLERFGVGVKALTAGLGGIPSATPRPLTALNFSGTTNRVTLNSFPSLEGDFTISVWARIANNNTGAIFSNSPAGGGSFRLVPRAAAGEWLVSDRTNAGAAAVLFSAINTNWQHLALVRDGTNLSLFVNGNLVGSTLALGLRDTSGWQLGPNFRGQLDEFQIWNAALSGADLRRYLRKQRNGNEEGLVAYFRFDEGAGASIISATPGGLSGSFVAGAGITWVTSTAPASIPPRFITLAENNDANRPELPTTLYVVRVDEGPTLGDLKVLPSDNVFDERVTMRHSGDFGGAPELMQFEWYYRPDTGGEVATNLPVVGANGAISNPNGWFSYSVTSNGFGINDVTLGEGPGNGLLLMSDNWFICRYRGYEIDGATNWSDWVGQPGGGRAQLVEGWIKRVLDGLNPFEQRSDSFHSTEVATYVNMLTQAGRRYEGPVAFNPDPSFLNSIGLIEGYSTVLNRAKTFSIEGTPPVNYEPANTALLLAAGRIADLYMLLGNEAYADSTDPTIGFATDGTGGTDYGIFASSIFAFQNQLDSMLEEELVLLRGRDDSAASVRVPPVYNRLFWNFSQSDGEVAYAQGYNVIDVNFDGFVNVNDAAIMFPQGHGDAWGHYLTAGKTYYDLLRNTNYTWVPRAESLRLGAAVVTVDYLDERKFARTAAAKARVGAETVNLTYRQTYVDDPSGQFQGYKDTNEERAWGLLEWAQRARQGAYLDWLMANAILPAQDPNPLHEGITQVDRTTVTEIGEISAQADEIQGQLDKADRGLNPLGLGKGVVSFDIDPFFLDIGSGTQSRTHFDQIYERAETAMNNAMKAFNNANQLTTSLRRQQDSDTEYARNIQEQERDFKSRLIEIFGYPYAGDIGPGKTYPSDYDGPDLYHYMYVNATELISASTGASRTFTNVFQSFEGEYGSFGFYFPGDTRAKALKNSVLQVPYPQTASTYGSLAPASWGQRRAPGELQLALSDLLQADAALRISLANYDSLVKQIKGAVELLDAQYALSNAVVSALSDQQTTVASLNETIRAYDITVRTLRRAGQVTRDVAEAAGALPDSLDETVLGMVRFGIVTASLIGSQISESIAEGFDGAITTMEISKENLELQTGLTIETASQSFEVRQRLDDVRQLIRSEPAARIEAYQLAETVRQTASRYQATLAAGQRILEERLAFRRYTAGDIQDSRYQDMTLRIFRNDAVQKYRAQFDLAARYVYLAATAYDYETQMLGSQNGSGRDFLTQIVKDRSLGVMDDGVPVVGQPGLADSLGRLKQNFTVLKGQLGLTVPALEGNKFSLRTQMLRISPDDDEAWRNELQKARVADLWQIPEFRRYCRPFAPESAGAQPGLVIRFGTTVTFGLNFFGWPLGGGDSSYDPTYFATKVRSAGVWFDNYDGSGLSTTPRVYLVPVGLDVLRSPTDFSLATREWKVLDQKIPPPFTLGKTTLQNPSYIPIHDSLSSVFGDVRKFSSLRAYHDGGEFDESEASTDTRLIGRSVWNTEWMLIIPGGTLLFNPDQGLNTFINSVGDIRIFFQSYSYSGN